MIRLVFSLVVFVSCFGMASDIAELQVGNLTGGGSRIFTPSTAKQAVEKNLGGGLFYVKDLIAREVCFRGKSKDVYREILEVIIENSGDESCRESNYTKDEITYSECRMEYTRYAIGIPRCDE